MDTEKPRLLLESLYARHTGLTPSLSGTFEEAASVCLNRHHSSPVDVRIVADGVSSKSTIEFEKPTTRVLNAWANTIDTTESGAYGVSLAAVEVVEDLIAVRRAETLTGADWYVAPIGASIEDLEGCFRLEVSGIDVGDWSAIHTRLQQKVRQTRRGASNLPAIASVVGFKERTVAIQTVSNEQ